jgi:hypothetical protein
MRPRRRAAASTAGPDRCREAVDVVAQRLANPPALEEVALHVDDDQRRAVEIDADRIGFCGNEG